MIQQIASGGQTGVDCAALHFALKQVGTSDHVD